MTGEMSFQLLLEDWQRSSGPDEGRKIIPPARNGERKCSGKWFCASLLWHHEATLAPTSQTCGGDVDCHKWVEVGWCWACGCSIASVTPPTRVRTNSPSWSRTRDSGVGGGRSNKERQRLQPLARLFFEVRGARFTHSPYWHTSVTLTPLNLTPIRVTAPM